MSRADNMAEKAMEGMTGAKLEDHWLIHERTDPMQDPRYLRGLIEGMKQAHETSIKLLIRALGERE